MEKKLFCTGFLLILSSVMVSQTQIGDDIDGQAANDNSGISVSTSADGSTVAIGANGNDENGYNSGQVRVYKKIAGMWSQIGQSINGEGIADNSGISVSLSSDGTILAVGSVYNDTNYIDAGQVRVLKNISGTWTQIGTAINGHEESDYAGNSVSLSADGSILAIGAYGNNTNGYDSGQVRIYKNIDDVWTQIGSDINGEASGDQSGTTIALSADGTIVAIGAPYNNGSGSVSGQVRIYKNTGELWTQIGVDINGEAAFDYSGYNSVSLSANGLIVAIGGFQNDGNGNNSGHVRVYQNIDNTWTQIGSDINGEAPGDFSGISTSLSADGNILAIGAYQNDGNGSNSGQVRIFKHIGTSWFQMGADINGETALDYSGVAVSLSNDSNTVAIGAYQNSGHGFASGQVRMYDISTVLSTENFSSKRFVIHPNPTSDKTTITLQEDQQLEKVNIYNTLGQLLKTDNKYELNISSLAKGNYFVEVITNQGKATKTIIVE